MVEVVERKLLLTVTPITGAAPLAISATCTDPRVTSQLLYWDFGDGMHVSDSSEIVQQHVYQVPGSYTITVGVGSFTGQQIVTVISTEGQQSAKKLPLVIGAILATIVLLGIGVFVLQNGKRISSTGTGITSKHISATAGACSSNASGTMERRAVSFTYDVGLSVPDMIAVEFPFTANGLTVKAAEGSQLQIYCGSTLVLNAAMHFCGYPPGVGKRREELTNAGATGTLIGKNAIYSSSNFLNEAFIFQGDNEVSASLNASSQNQEIARQILGTLTMSTLSCSAYSKIAAEHSAYLMQHVTDVGVLTQPEFKTLVHHLAV